MENDNAMVDAVGQLEEGQTLVFLLFHRVHSVYAGPMSHKHASRMNGAYRFESRNDATAFRSRRAFPNRWDIVPAVYDAIADTVTPVGG
jgi:hypothetical protein